MSTTTLCPKCGYSLPSDAPAGQCPACLLRPTSEHSRADNFGTFGPGKVFSPPTTAELQEHFPQFEIRELIGRGGMGAVYLAHQRSLSRPVAIKILPPQLAEAPGFSDRFAREARALAKLNHPGIVGIYDFGKAGPYAYLVMEYVDGVNLRSLLREGHLKPEEALQIVPLLCDALQTAHAFGVVHRDIKPENILLTTDGRVKVADFGVAKIAEHDGQAADSSHTRNGGIVGTFQYMAPEQFERPAHVDHRADIYSLGVVFYEMLTGELPLGRFPNPSTRTGVDIRLDNIVLRALEKQPELRYATAAHVKSDVETLSHSAPSSSDPLNHAANSVLDSDEQTTSSRLENAFNYVWQPAKRAKNAMGDFVTNRYRQQLRDFKKINAFKRTVGRIASQAYRFVLARFSVLKTFLSNLSAPIIIAFFALSLIVSPFVVMIDSRGIREEEAISFLAFGLITAYLLLRVAYLYIEDLHVRTIPQRVTIIWPLRSFAVSFAVAAVSWPIVVGIFGLVALIVEPPNSAWLTGPYEAAHFVASSVFLVGGTNWSILCLGCILLPGLIKEGLKPFKISFNNVILLVLLTLSIAITTLGAFMMASFMNN